MKQVLISLLFVFSTGLLQSQEVKRIKITELEATIKKAENPLIVNFWATFCVPCLEELPYFQSLTKKYVADSVQLILVSLDFKEAVPKRLLATAKKFRIEGPLLWLDETDADYFCTKIDSSWSGGIPGTLFINNKTGYRQFFEEQLSQEKLQKEILHLISTITAKTD